MNDGPPDRTLVAVAVDLSAQPPVDRPLLRLKVYQEQHALEEERRRMAEVASKQDLWLPLTPADLAAGNRP